MSKKRKQNKQTKQRQAKQISELVDLGKVGTTFELGDVKVTTLDYVKDGRRHQMLSLSYPLIAPTLDVPPKEAAS